MLSSSATFSPDRLYPTVQREKPERSIRDIVSSHENGMLYTLFNMDDLKISTTEMHTGGAPFRIIETGFPEIKGKTVLDKMRYARENFDFIRKMMMFEPRGHFDMFGVILVEPDIPEADIGTIFIHNEGYSTMCGHGVIALGRYVIDHGIVKPPVEPETKVVIQCPCGPVEAFVEYNNGRTGGVRFRSVPAFVFALGKWMIRSAADLFRLFIFICNTSENFSVRTKP